MIRNFEFYTGRSSGRLYKFEVLITTFELVLKDAPTLGKVKWNYLMVDEAHRLKNHEAALYQARARRSQPASWRRRNSIGRLFYIGEHAASLESHCIVPAIETHGSSVLCIMR